MTTVAWDGKTIAADRLADRGGLPTACRKLFCSEEIILGCAGSLCYVLDLWAEIGRMRPHEILGGRFLADAPRDELPSAILVIRHAPMYAHLLTGNRFVQIEDPLMAIGSGRDFAIAAMALGKTAAEAVELASRFDIYTGVGVDSLEIAQC